jgi:hypothetical protein
MALIDDYTRSMIKTEIATRGLNIAVDETKILGHTLGVSVSGSDLRAFDYE